MANDPDIIELSPIPSYTSSRPPSYKIIQDPPQAYTYTPVGRCIYTPQASVSSSLPVPSPQGLRFHSSFGTHDNLFGTGRQSVIWDVAVLILCVVILVGCFVGFIAMIMAFCD